MKILIVTAKKPKKRFLVKLHTAEHVDEVKNLINKGKHSQAIVFAMSKGKIDKYLACHEVYKTQAELMLTEEAARWDLVNHKL